MRPRLYSKKGLISLGAQNINVMRLSEARTRFTMLESLFTRLYGQKTAWRFLDILLKDDGFRSKFLFLTVALGNEHMFSIANLL